MELLMVTRNAWHYQGPKAFPLFDQRRLDRKEWTAVSLRMMKKEDNVGKLAWVLNSDTQAIFDNQRPSQRSQLEGGLDGQRQSFWIERHTSPHFRFVRRRSDGCRLCLLQIGEFLYEFLLAISRKRHREFHVIAGTFTAKHEAAAVFYVSDMRTRNESCFGRGFWPIVLDLGGAGRLQSLKRR